MRKLILCISICTMIFLMGCKKEVYIPIETQSKIELCHSEEDLLPLNLKRLDNEYPVFSTKNEDIKLQNILLLKSQNESFRAIIECYEKQLVKSNP